MENFQALNELELSLMAAKDGRIPVNEFLTRLIACDLALPSAKEVQENGSGFEPIIFERQGVSMLAVFTDISRVSILSHVAKYCLVMNGFEIVRRIPPGHGIVINPGLQIGLELSPEGISKIIQDFAN